MSFARRIARLILRRDKHKCVDCGRNRSDGVELQASHKDEVQSKDHPLSNKVAGGESRCVDCHIKQHERLLEKATTKEERSQHKRAVTLLKSAPLRRKRWRAWYKNLWKDD